MRPDPDRDSWIMSDGRGRNLENTLQRSGVVAGLERQERQLHRSVKMLQDEVVRAWCLA
jgi:hypothetical protein